MKVLLSGMTNIQAHRPRRREYNTSINAFYHALKDAKHAVDWRPLAFNEKGLAKQYDLLILGLGTISEFSCHYLYETLLAASQHDNVLFLVNDWKANLTIKMLMTGDILRDFVRKNNTGSRLPEATVAKHETRLLKCRDQLWQHTNLIGPFFNGWGNRVIITEGTPFEKGVLHEFDPSMFYMKHWGFVETPSKKVKRWVYGALNNYDKWVKRLEPSWPVQQFDKKTFIPETELVDLWYATSVGMLMPKYKASGSGWWRARYCHAVACQNVIYADETEIQDIPSDFWRPVQEIEELSDRQLRAFAKNQCESLHSMMSSWPKVVRHVNDIVHGLVI